MTTTHIQIREQKMDTTRVYRDCIRSICIYCGYIGIVEDKMETTINIIGLYWGYVGIMGNQMEISIMCYLGFRFWSLRFN